MLTSEISIYGIESLKYIFQLRGIFKTHYTRENRNNAEGRKKLSISPFAALGEL